LLDSGKARAKLAAELMMHSIFRSNYFAPHDPLAFYCVEEPKIVKTVEGLLEVDTSNSEQRGRTKIVTSRQGAKQNQRAASEVDGQRFKQELYEILTSE